MTILFKELIEENQDTLKDLMTWENYDLNEVEIPVTELLKDHSLMVLSKSYGNYSVDQEILDEVCADVFIYFPILMQQLAISRLMDAYGVVPDDENTDTLTRTETLTGVIAQDSELSYGLKTVDTNVLNTEQDTTGTTTINSQVDNTQNTEIEIENTSGVESTGSRNVNLNHNLPEQSINGSTGNFPIDPQGTPILTTSYVQNATENFNTSNPISTTETSTQSTAITGDSTTIQSTTNSSNVKDTGDTERTMQNSGKDNSESNTTTNNTNTIEETRTQKQTNKQYAYEIKAFLESTDTLVAFSRWEDRFSWVVGII